MPQLSVAVGGFQLTAALQLVLNELMVISAGIFVSEGKVPSITIIFCRHAAVIEGLLGSVAVHLLWMSAAPVQLPKPRVVSVKVTIGLLQLELPANAVAVPAIDGDGTVPVGQALYVPGHVIVGFELHPAQLTVTLNDAVDILPQLSVAV